MDNQLSLSGHLSAFLYLFRRPKQLEILTKYKGVESALRGKVNVNLSKQKLNINLIKTCFKQFFTFRGNLLTWPRIQADLFENFPMFQPSQYVSSHDKHS